jgi:hypothetical protein
MKTIIGSLFLFITTTILGGIAIAESDLAPLLKGLTGIGIHVLYDVSGNWNAVSKKDVQTEVELRLRRSGINVNQFNPYEPYLQITFNVFNTSLSGQFSDTYILFTQAYLREQVAPARKVNFRNNVFIGSTWDTDGTMYAFNSRINVMDILHQVDAVVDQFINDYLAANPK